MLDINFVENNLDYVKKQLNKRGLDFSLEIDFIVKLNIERKNVLKDVEIKKSLKNSLSKEIGLLMKNNELDKVEKNKNQVNELNSDIEVLDKKLFSIINKLNEKLLYIPNIPNEHMPIGLSDEDNPIIKVWNSDNLVKHKKPHWEIASQLNLVDFESGPKLSGSRFVVYKEQGSKLVRALTNILLDKHISVGYKEITVPLIVNAAAMQGTGQLPKFEEDAYKVGEQYLIPTGEVPLTNLHANEILDYKKLPIKYTTFSQCFRKEAGSAGKDTKGLIRLHQFNKVELVKITDQESSFNELELMLVDAESILQLFNLPYRIVELCTGDVGFSSTKTFDIEVWFPEQNKYREISSVSNCIDFQSRNMATRYKTKDGKTKLVHTLNGSGVAIDRLVGAILENYWDGEKLILPEILKAWFDNQEYIK
ncbi:serine--tRNA ligase [Mesoplasma corruscae]|uniref:Serine--tRNA ligase n=1 Tax=Mesoplasma corruscae TaxID=216874 RepID=A0A2S5RHG8_9MOLU|nr:serine--tRNA ligase [Mesoplasma corruscae]PPE06662.1 seryl-tRNA synthetase [Mesoplasma corruscae]